MTRRHLFMTLPVVARTIAVLLAASLLISCAGADDDTPDSDAGSITETDGDDDRAQDPPEPSDPPETEPDRRAPPQGTPVSTVTIDPIDAPRSSTELRVGEIILEFDGEVTDEGTVLTLDEPILFDLDSAELKPESQEPLDDIAEVVAFYEEAPVQVIGHTDDQGSREYNLNLSEQRAEAVVASLVERGIPTRRLTSEGRAFDEPVATDATEVGRAANRRVAVLLVGVVPPDDTEGSSSPDLPE